MRAYLQTLRSFNREVYLYLITSAVFGLTVFGGIQPTLLNLYLLRLGYGPEFVGLVNALGHIGTAILALPAGSLSNRFGLRTTMFGGLLLAGFSFGLFPLADLIPAAWQSAWLLTTNFLGQVGVVLYIVNGNPYLMSIARDSQRNHVFSVQGAMWPLAGFGGSLIGGFLPAAFAGLFGLSLAGAAAYRFPLLLSALALILATPALLRLPEVHLKHEQPTLPTSSAALNRFPLMLVGVLVMFGMLRVAGEGTARTFFNVYLDAGLALPTAQIGIIMSLGQLLAVPTAMVMPLFVRRLGLGGMIIAGTVGMALSMLPLALIPHWLAAAASYMGLIALTAITRPAYIVFTQEIIQPRWRAMMSGATTLAAGSSWAMIALGGGILVALLGYQSLFLVGAGLTLSAALLFALYFRVPRGEFARPPQADAPAAD